MRFQFKTTFIGLLLLMCNFLFRLKFERIKDTECLLKGICLYRKPSDGINYKWGGRQIRHRRSLEREPSNGIYSGYPLIHQSNSIEFNPNVADEEFNVIDERVLSDDRQLVQRTFITSKHDTLFDSLTPKLTIYNITSVIIFPHVYLCKDITEILIKYTGNQDDIVTDPQALIHLFENNIVLNKHPDMLLVDMGMNLDFIKNVRDLEKKHEKKEAFILGIYDKHIRNPLGIADEYNLTDFVLRSELKNAFENIIKGLI